MVRLAPKPRDGRSKRVWLTDAGRALRETAMRLLAPDIARIADRLPCGITAQMLPILCRLRDVFDAERDAATVTAEGRDDRGDG